MEHSTVRTDRRVYPIIKNLPSSGLNQVFLAIIVFSVLLGLGTGFVLAQSNRKTAAISQNGTTTQTPQIAAQDTKTFRDFAEGKLVKKPEPKSGEDYTEGTHLLLRDGSSPVALTSSVIDLSQYEGKNVKVYGETQKALKEGWLMDVGKVEVIN